MNTLNILAESDTFISSYYPTGNYSDLDYLLVNMSLEDPYQYTASLMQFNLCPLASRISEICSIRLNLFIDSIEFNNLSLDILINNFFYDYLTVTWDTKPVATEIITPLIVSKDYLHKYIEIGATCC